MPTRNRANILPHALQSALEQTLDDYEIIVSDNNSTPETQAVVRQFADPRIRYIRLDRTLAMPESWEFALSHAQGEYVTILSDDDAVSPTMLARLDGLLRDRPVKLLSWIRYLYVMPDWYEESDRNKLFLAPVTGQAHERSSESMLRQWFDGCHYYSNAPMIFNSCCHRSIIERAKTKTGRLFLGAAPDIASSLVLLSEIPTFTFVDDVLSLAGSGQQSIGANSIYNRSGPYEEFVTQLADDEYPRGPFKARLLTTSVADTLLSVKRALPDRFASYDINWASYFVGCYRDLTSYGTGRGIDVTDERKQLWSLVLEQTAEVQIALLHFVMSQEKAGAVDLSKERDDFLKVAARQEPAAQKEFVDYIEASSNTKQTVSSASQATPAEDPYVISGMAAGFNNILECARKLDSYVTRIKSGEFAKSAPASVAAST